MRDAPRIMGFATQGASHSDADRLRVFLAACHADEIRLARRPRRAFARGLWRTLSAQRPDVILLEGTGVAGGLVLLAARARLGTRYVVSTGDAVGPFLGLKSPLLGALGGVYERALYRWSSGVIGWTPYLSGRALTLGAPAAMTAPGWAPEEWPAADDQPAWTGLREKARREFRISADDIVVGIVGSLNWTPSRRYCYGMELVDALAHTSRPDVRVMIVGDGDGQPRLRDRAAELDVSDRVTFTGRVARTDVPSMLSAFDLASLPQSLDQIGAFRYSTKLAEYVHAGLPIVTGRLPLAYDLDHLIFARLPGKAPWDRAYAAALGALLDTATHDEVARARATIDRSPAFLDRDTQAHRVGAFLRDVALA